MGGDGLRIRVQRILAFRAWQTFPIPVGPLPSIWRGGWGAPLGALVGLSLPEPVVQMSRGHHRPLPHRSPNPAFRSPRGAWPPPHCSHTLAWAGHEQVLCWRGGGRKGYRLRPEAPAASRRGQQGRVDWKQAAVSPPLSDCWATDRNHESPGLSRQGSTRSVINPGCTGSGQWGASLFFSFCQVGGFSSCAGR